MGRVARIACPRCVLDVGDVAPTTRCPRCGGVLEAHVVVCVVTGHGLKQATAAETAAEPVVTVGPSLSDLESAVRRWT
jgi:hypothetical protein